MNDKILCPCGDVTCPYYNWDTDECELENAVEECDEIAMVVFEDGEF